MMVSQTILLTAGAVIVVGGILFYRCARASRILAMIAVLGGAAILAVGAQPTLIRHFIGWRLRLVMLSASLLILYITFDRIRHAALKERYALLWIGTSLGFLLLAIFPDLIIGFIQVSGMQYTTAIMMLVFVFLLLITFHFSLALSRGEEDRRRLAQDLALLEEQLERLRETISESAAPSAAESDGRRQGTGNVPAETDKV